uniref:Uncharacterized protein n=1 Tax=Arundo donax TaxID=35708 RepID=A0A0A9CL10_ARUDO
MCSPSPSWWPRPRAPRPTRRATSSTWSPRPCTCLPSASGSRAARCRSACTSRCLPTPTSHSSTPPTHR